MNGFSMPTGANLGNQIGALETDIGAAAITDSALEGLCTAQPLGPTQMASIPPCPFPRGI